MTFLRIFNRSANLIPQSHLSCVAQVQKYDRENYLAALYIKEFQLRRSIFALRAFNVELALIKDKTTDINRAKGRFFFWTKLIDEIVKRNQLDPNEIDPDKTNSYYKFTPVAKELMETLQPVDINKELEQYLRDLIGARLSSKVLGHKPFETIDDLEIYCAKSNSSLYQMAWNISSQFYREQTSSDMRRNLCNIAQCLGISQGLSNVIRATPHNAAKGYSFMPKSLLEDTRLTPNDFILTPSNKNLDSKKICPAIECLANRCQNLLDQVHSDTKSVPHLFRVLFLPRITIQLYLNKLKKYNYEIYHPKLGARNHMLPLRLWLAS